MRNGASDSRRRTGAQPSQGRGAGAPAAAPAASLDGARKRAGYDRAKHRPSFDAERVPITAVLAHYNALAKLRRYGGNLVGACPIHGGSNRRQFNVNVADRTWYCFGDCNRGGGVLDLVAALEGVALAEAAARVSEWFALSPPGKLRRRKKAMANRPTHKVLSVTERSGDGANAKAYYTRIGAGWPIKNGSGISLQLDALPLNGRLIVLEMDEEDNASAVSAERAKDTA